VGATISREQTDHHLQWGTGSILHGTSFQSGSSVLETDPFPTKDFPMKPLPTMLITSATVIMVSSFAFAQSPQAPAEGNVLTYHGAADRSGTYKVQGLTWDRAKSVRLDEAFRPHITGHVYAQPLYWRPQGSDSGRLLVASEDNNIDALDASTGAQIWSRSLGNPVPRSALRCGNISPLGITGTPVIDEGTGAVYLDAAVADSSGPHHRIFALSLEDGNTLPGWPVDVADALRGSRPFNSRDQNQRGALTVVGGTVYVPFGGHFGDCGDYRGWVVGVSLQDPRKIISWSTRARGGGIWAPAGISVVGRSLFVATGNAFGASNWSDGEAVFRLSPDLRRSNDNGITSHPPIGMRSTSAISTWAELLPFRSLLVISLSFWLSVRMGAPTCLTRTILEPLAGASQPKPFLACHSARRPQSIR
jgi:hypothetical protein